MNSQCNGSFLPKWQETRRGTVALLRTVCSGCPFFWGSALMAPKRPRWPTFGERPADGAVLRPRGPSQRAPNLRVLLET